MDAQRKNIFGSDYPRLLKQRVEESKVDATTHGAKMSAEWDKSVREQGEALNFYQSYRNEPVPPDPRITSAVKLTSAVRPDGKSKIPKDIEATVPLKKVSSIGFFANGVVSQRAPTSIPIPVTFSTLSISSSNTPSSNRDFVTASEDTPPATRKILGKDSSDFASGSFTPLDKSSGANGGSDGDYMTPGSNFDSEDRNEQPALMEKESDVSWEEEKGTPPPQHAALSGILSLNSEIEDCKFPDDIFEAPPDPRAHSSRCEVPKETLYQNSNNTSPDKKRDTVHVSRLLQCFAKVAKVETLVDVEIVAISGRDFRNLVIRSVKKSWVGINQELDRLEAQMYQEVLSQGLDVTNRVTEPVSFEFYAFVVHRKRTCVRVQVLKIFNNCDPDAHKRNKVLLFFVDYGQEILAHKDGLIILQPEWTSLPQLAIHAYLSGPIRVGYELPKDGPAWDGRHYENKHICIMPLEMTDTLASSENNRAFGIESLEINFFCEQHALAGFPEKKEQEKRFQSDVGTMNDN